MFGTNKIIEVFRISGTDFVHHLTHKVRYEPKKFTSMREQQVKANHLTYTMYCDTADIFLKDKVVHGNKEFIVSGVAEYSDGLGMHQEIMMRETNSRIHEIITIQTLSDIQTNYDELLGEWSGTKDIIETDVNVIVDIAAVMKENFIKMLPAGKIELTEWIVTIDYPTIVTELDKIVYNGITYEIKWIIPFPHQQVIGLKKYIKNYDK